MNQIAVMGICTIPIKGTDFMVRSPAFLHVRCLQDPKKNRSRVMIPMAEIEGTVSEIRKKAHEMVDRALDAFEESQSLEAPKGTLVTRDEREEP